MTRLGHALTWRSWGTATAVSWLLVPVLALLVDGDDLGVSDWMAILTFVWAFVWFWVSLAWFALWCMEGKL